MVADKNQKGKQATKGAKQIVEENVQTLTFYRNMIFGANLVYFGLMMLFRNDSYTLSEILLFLFGAAVYIGSYQFMNFMAKAQFGEGKQILDSGVDLNMEHGLAEYVKDLIILTSICQLGGFFTTYFWLLWLAVPIVGFYFAWSKLIAPWVFAPAPEQTVTDEKKQRKMERKMRR